MTYLDQIESLPPEIIQHYRQTGKSQAIAVEVQKFIDEVDAVMQIRTTEKFDNISQIARELQLRYPHLSFRNARERVYDAYNLFHVNDTVSNDAWDNLYADKLESLAKLCIAKGKEETAKGCLLKAHELRTKSENRIKPEDLKAPVFIISMEIKPEDLGFEKQNLREIYKEANQGKFRKMIDSFDFDKEEKKRLYEDAQIAEIIDEEDE